MNMKKLKKEIIEAQNRYEREKEEYKEFIENYKIGQGNYLVYLYFTSDDAKEFDMEYYIELTDIIYNLLITEKNFNENEAEKLTEKLSEEFTFNKAKDLTDKNIRKFVLNKLK